MSREGISPIVIATVLVVLAILSGGIAYWWMGQAPDGSTPDLVGSTEPGPLAGSEAPAAIEATEPPPKPEIPPLDASDRVLREWVQGLSSHPRLARWLTSEDLVRRFVASVDSVARGESPRGQLEMMQPSEAFQVTERNGRLYIDPSNYERYDLAADVFVSLDIGESVRLFHEFEPLFEEAYAEIAEPGRSFRQTFAEALDQVLAVELPINPPEVEQHLLVYRFADPELEAASPAVKHLLRMGPENAQRVQNRIRFLRSALALDSPAPER